VGEKTQSRVQIVRVLVRDHDIALIPELGDRIGDRVVQAAIENPELVHFDLRIQLECKIGDGLAKIAVVVDHFLDSEAVLHQFLAVLGRRVTYL
jgi:predicted sulfurtransferase